MAFIAELIIQIVRMLLIAAVAFGGIIAGKKLRERSNAKKQ